MDELNRPCGFGTANLIEYPTIKQEGTWYESKPHGLSKYLDFILKRLFIYVCYIGILTDTRDGSTLAGEIRNDFKFGKLT